MGRHTFFVETQGEFMEDVSPTWLLNSGGEFKPGFGPIPDPQERLRRKIVRLYPTNMAKARTPNATGMNASIESNAATTPTSVHARAG